MSLASCGRHAPKPVAPSSAMAGQSASSPVRIVNHAGASDIRVMIATLTQSRSDRT